MYVLLIHPRLSRYSVLHQQLHEISYSEIFGVPIQKLT